MSRNIIINRLVTLGVLIAVSCSFFTSPTASTPSTTANQEVSVIITASQGGELTLPENAVLKIPADSLQTDTQVSLSKINIQDRPAVTDELSIVGGAYDINLGTASLQKPATLEIPFDPTLLPDGIDPGQVFLSYYDEINMEWVYAGGVVDTNRNVVVLEITHASLWTPTTWNWGAWIAVLNKLLRVSIVDWVEAVQLLTADCSQTGNYVQVDSSQARYVMQGCVEQDDIERPVLRIINPKSFFYEIKPISGGNGYPSPTLLAPGEDVKFEASTSDPSPLIIEAQMTEKSGWYLVVHMVITMLPGANQFGIQGRDVACITERLADVSYFASAVESLLVDQNGAAAAESIINFMRNGDAVRRFITAADDCNFGPAPTWSVEGIKQIGGALSTIMSAMDYIANYFAGNTDAQLSFTWASPPTAISYATAIAKDGKVYLGNNVIFDMAQENLGCFDVGEVAYSPTGKYFLVVLNCFERDNEAFLFRADGSDKRRITGKWDYINEDNYEWSSDGQSFVYQRINSCCVASWLIPADAPPEGLVLYDVQTGEKKLLATPTPPASLYRVVNVQSNDVLNVRSGPGIDYPIVGIIPYNGIDIRITGAGVVVGQSFWYPIQYNEITGWVNSAYLAEQPHP